MELATHEHINLNWLLLGDGAPNREAVPLGEPLSDRLRAHTLRALLDAGHDEVHADVVLPDGTQLLTQVVRRWSEIVTTAWEAMMPRLSSEWEKRWVRRS